MNAPVSLNLDYHHAARLLLPAYQTVNLTLIGCGGTGSWLAPSLARIARLLVDKFDRRVNLVFIDGDRVEVKNVYRQNFAPAEVGRNKAVSLAFRYGLAWGVEIAAVDRPFSTGIADALGHMNDRDQLPVVIGCVDNHIARLAIRDLVDAQRHRIVWWLDCGNHKSAGQVALGTRPLTPQDRPPFELTGFCTWLPSPAVQYPDLVLPPPLPAPEASDSSDLSCADLAMLDDQGLAINQRIAAEAADFLVRLLLTQDLRRFSVALDLASGVARSRYITPGEVLGEASGPSS